MWLWVHLPLKILRKSTEGSAVSEQVGNDGFHPSSFSAGGNCVEVRSGADGRFTVRHSRDRDGELTFTRAEWDAFVRGVKDGQFDPM